MGTWVLRLANDGQGPRLAVKDCIDVAGVPTTAGCPVVAEMAEPAEIDAAVVASAREGGARIVGKTGLTELCWSANGVNHWSGTPVNPRDPRRLPGGSSSGSAVAVATGEADVAFGTDTGGSVRIPAACCGVAGLKTAYGRISVKGVYPLAPSLDTIGALGADVAAVELGMRLLEPGFAAPPAQTSALALVYQGERQAVTKDRFIIGRGKQSSDLTLKDPNVSRQHAMVEFQNGVYFMVDMGSTNGVEYNGQRIARRQIAEGDVYRICDHAILFTYR